MGTVNFEPVRERQITIKATDRDFEKLQERCSGYGITIDELLEGFVGDLVDGVYSTAATKDGLQQSGLTDFPLICFPTLTCK